MSLEWDGSNTQSKVVHKGTGYLLTHGHLGRPLWLSIHVGKDMSDYYIWLCHTRLRHRYNITRPKWNAHISIVRDELPYDTTHAQTLDHVPVEFEYEHEVYRAGRHFCMNVRCPTANNIRVALGLPYEPRAPFHLTIGVLDGNIHEPGVRMNPPGEYLS